MADTGRRSYAVTLIAGLASAGAVAVGVTRPWVGATAAQTGLPPISASVDGADITPLAGALGVVLLASFGAVIATRGWVRRGLGALIAVCAAVVLVAAVTAGSATSSLESALSDKGWSGGTYDSTTEAWRWLVVVGAVFCVAAGATVARLGGQWATMGARYDAPRSDSPPPAEPDSLSEADVWKAIDRGHDPTQAP